MTNYKVLHAYVVGAVCYLVAFTIAIGSPWSFILFAVLGNLCHYIGTSFDRFDKTMKITFYSVCVIQSIAILTTAWCFYFAPHPLIY
jgi:hypothetical protein